jgi:hypothetical protein
LESTREEKEILKNYNINTFENYQIKIGIIENMKYDMIKKNEQ